nr:nudix hydrolase 26, chloroplastic-like isoform X2 [Populus alba]
MEVQEIAICRSVFYYPTLLRRPLQHQVLYTSTCRFPNYPSKFPKSTKVPLLHRSPRPRCTSSMESPSEGYRKNVGICLINPSKKGGIDESEDPKVAAIRELKEETGVSSAEVLAETPSWLTYDFPPEVREKLKHQWGSDWKGQAQKWFLLKFTGNEEEINLLGDGTEKPEFGEWSWMSPEQIIDWVVDFKKPVYKEVLAVFAPYFQ